MHRNRDLNYPVTLLIILFSFSLQIACSSLVCSQETFFSEPSSVCPTSSTCVPSSFQLDLANSTSHCDASNSLPPHSEVADEEEEEQEEDEDISSGHLTLAPLPGVSLSEVPSLLSWTRLSSSHYVVVYLPSPVDASQECPFSRRLSRILALIHHLYNETSSSSSSTSRLLFRRILDMDGDHWFRLTGSILRGYPSLALLHNSNIRTSFPRVPRTLPHLLNAIHMHTSLAPNPKLVEKLIRAHRIGGARMIQQLWKREDDERRDERGEDVNRPPSVDVDLMLSIAFVTFLILYQFYHIFTHTCGNTNNHHKKKEIMKQS